tara:strand:+ start:402 stop:614 length:213 start_codon:yes stop_codon:yes gene_type:complete
MKAKDYLKNNVPFLKEDLEKNYLRSYTEEVMEQYANQRVIEELEKITEDSYIDLWELIDNLEVRIRELKQ